MAVAIITEDANKVICVFYGICQITIPFVNIITPSTNMGVVIGLTTSEPKFSVFTRFLIV